MLREDKSVRIERVELSAREMLAQSEVDDATRRVSLLADQIALDERTIERCPEEIEELRAQRQGDSLAIIDRLLSSKARQMKAQADREHWEASTRLNAESRAAQQRLDVNREVLAAADADRAAATRELRDAEEARRDTHQVYGKDHYAYLSQQEYEGHASTQAVTPVLLATWDAKNLWWYLGRFWWDSEGLDADDVRALVLQRDKKKQVTLERARADAFGSTTTEGEQVARRAPIPESVRHEVWRRDQGGCVDCGSRENLEFDHIIPVSKGGSNTARNLELRCEKCNRRKGATI